MHGDLQRKILHKPQRKHQSANRHVSKELAAQTASQTKSFPRSMAFLDKSSSLRSAGWWVFVGKWMRLGRPTSVANRPQTRRRESRDQAIGRDARHIPKNYRLRF